MKKLNSAVRELKRVFELLYWVSDSMIQTKDGPSVPDTVHRELVQRYPGFGRYMDERAFDLKRSNGNQYMEQFASWHMSHKALGSFDSEILKEANDRIAEDVEIKYFRLWFNERSKERQKTVLPFEEWIEIFWRWREEMPDREVEDFSPLKEDSVAVSGSCLDDYIFSNASKIYYRFRESLYTANEFDKKEDELWYNKLISSKDVKFMVSLKPDEDKIGQFPTDAEVSKWQEKMTHFLMKMNDKTADILDIISACWMQKARYPEQMIFLQADDFLRFRGIKPKKSGTGRRGGFHDALRREISEHISILDNTWINVFEMDIYKEVDGKRKKIPYRGQSRAIVVEYKGGQPNMLGGIDAYQWLIRPGIVFSQFLFGAGRQTALLSLKALEYDPYREKWEKRLTRYLAWIWKIKQSKKSYLEPIRVSTLLEAVREDLNLRFPSRIKEKLEKVLDKLAQDEVIASWQYDESIYAIEEMIDQKIKGWVSRWFQQRLFIEPPREIIDQYQKIKVVEPRTKAIPIGDLPFPQALKQRRETLGLTQMQAAEETNVPQQTYSRAERGLPINNQTRAKLERWLSSTG